MLSFCFSIREAPGGSDHFPGKLRLCVCVCKQEAFESSFWSWYLRGPGLDFENKYPITSSPKCQAFGPRCSHCPQPAKPPHRTGSSQPLIGMLTPRAASICNASSETIFRFPCPVWEEDAGRFFFFSLAPGQTGKINLALLTRHTSPP